MKRFILFAGDNYYPGGGMSDMVTSFDDLQEAKRHWDQDQAQAYEYDRHDWGHILDRETGAVTQLKK